MPSRDYYLKESSRRELLAYYRLMVEVSILLGSDSATAEQDMKDVLAFEIFFANVNTFIATSLNIWRYP